MALPQEDIWLGVAGLGAIAFGYWWFSRQSDKQNSSPSSIAASEDAGVSPLTAGMDTQANNVTTPSDVYGNTGSDFTSPQGESFLSYGQTYPLSTNM